MTPPPLAWLDGFCHSLSGALGYSVSFDVGKTVNPLIFKIKMRLGEPLTGKQLMLVWNLFQKYAAKNECVPQGKTEGWGKELIMDVAVTRRMGPTRSEHPLE